MEIIVDSRVDWKIVDFKVIEFDVINATKVIKVINVISFINVINVVEVVEDESWCYFSYSCTNFILDLVSFGGHIEVEFSFGYIFKARDEAVVSCGVVLLRLALCFNLFYRIWVAD